MLINNDLKPPLFTMWQQQHTRLVIEGLKCGDAVAVAMDGTPVEFQYTGHQTELGAEIMLRLGFEGAQARRLTVVPAEGAIAHVERFPLGDGEPLILGMPNAEVLVSGHGGPLAGFAGFPVRSSIACRHKLIGRAVARTHDGPLFAAYEIVYSFADNNFYKLQLRCYRHERIVEVEETFSLGQDSALEITLNPARDFDRVLSHGPFDFEGEGQVTDAPLGDQHPNDLLCRLQMPMLSEYTVPRNRGWIALYDSRREERGMLGLLGLHGAAWVNPVDNMPHIYDADGTVRLRAPLGSGVRHWMLAACPVEKQVTPGRLYFFHRLPAEFDALRLDEHLDLTGEEIYDADSWESPGFFGADYRDKAKRNREAILPLRKAVLAEQRLNVRVVFDPQPAMQQEILTRMLARFEKWIRDFQGFREGKSDYNKNVIGFSRALRGILLDYELLRKDRFLDDAQIGKLHSYFSFAARRILDEGRWPHSHTWQHPDHPASMRDLYTYPGEHRPDRLVWTNSLPNFQSDPMAALLHLSAILPEHPQAAAWQRFAQDDVERQLTAYCGQSGAWEESINYALYTFCYFVVTFTAVKNRLGIDYFQDSRFRAYAGWLTRFFGPYDKRIDSYTFPGIGNSSLPTLGGEIFLAYANELDPGDPLREDFMSIYQKMEPTIDYRGGNEFGTLLMATRAAVPDRGYPLRPLSSEHMDEIGVAMRHEHPSPHESYLFQKIGFAKDHYENDETAFNWYAKGTPLTMDYGTYTPKVAPAAAHNLVEIPDMDSLRRGYLAEKLFTQQVDYSRCEVPVTLKLLHGSPRSFAEMEAAEPPVFFYIGDNNPLGSKVWKTRLLLFVKPDYVVLFDRVCGPVAHRYNLHVTADEIVRDQQFVMAPGRFDLDLLCYIQHPREFKMETGELDPGGHRPLEGLHPQRQKFLRIYNESDNIYRTLLFAREREGAVSIESIGTAGIKITTEGYTDYVFIDDQMQKEQCPEVGFTGRVGWIRRTASGAIMACVPDGDAISAFGQSFTGRGPWSYNMRGDGKFEIEGVPRTVLHVT